MIQVPPSDDSSVDARLADLLALDPEAPEVWSELDLASIWRHQLNMPLAADLARIPAAELELQRWQEATGIVDPALGDLLRHPDPPLQLLLAVKRFGKNVCDWQPEFPAEIASAIYFAAIAAATVTHRQSISSLPTLALAEGLQWVASQPWIDSGTRSACDLALRNCTASDA